MTVRWSNHDKGGRRYVIETTEGQGSAKRGVSLSRVTYHLAQLNIGRLKHPAEDPRVAGFFDELDRINALADEAPGFVWRLQTDSGNATDIDVFGDPLEIVNLSVWESVEHLKAFT